MRSYDVSLITSVASISVKVDDSSTIEEYLAKAKEGLQNFLKITSLEYSTWHEWAFVAMYQKEDNSDTYSFICADLDPPKIKDSPNGFHLTSPAHSSIFIPAAWKGYTNTLNEKYGFDYALEWYVESSSLGVSETKFLNATTALELLMDYFHRINNTENYEGNDFDRFYKEVKKMIEEKLVSSNIDEGIKNSLRGYITGMKRRSYTAKAELLIHHWGISKADLGISSIREITDVRDEITHTGRYLGRGEDNHPFETLRRIYRAIFTILTRIFLAMLNYTEDYKDMSRNGEFVRLPDVCASVKTQ